MSLFFMCVAGVAFILMCMVLLLKLMTYNLHLYVLKKKIGVSGSDQVSRPAKTKMVNRQGAKRLD